MCTYEGGSPAEGERRATNVRTRCYTVSNELKQTNLQRAEICLNTHAEVISYVLYLEGEKRSVLSGDGGLKAK